MARLTLLTTIALISCAVTFALPAPESSGDLISRPLCASEPPDDFLKVAADMAENGNASPLPEDSYSSPRGSAPRQAAPVTSISVDVFLHVVASSTALIDGYIPDSQVDQQFKVLRDTYAKYGINLRLNSTDRTINTAWATDVLGKDLEMKKKLRRGDYRALNIYIIKSPRNKALGYCSFPGKVKAGSDNFYYDGCTIRFDTVPGGKAYNFNMGRTAVHETGHWLGLLHTFQGGNCTGAGDMVSDTPAQLSPTNGCPTGRDSCPGQAGTDPITNFMDYSIDSCYSNFTVMQKKRMFNMWTTYRAP